MGGVGDIFRKLLPWQVTTAERLAQHAAAGTVPTKREAIEWVKTRRTRIAVGTGVAAGAAVASLAGVPGFADGGLEGKLNEHTVNSASNALSADATGLKNEILATARTLRSAGERAYEDPARIPAFALNQLADDTTDHVRNLVTTVALIEAGGMAAGAWRRRGKNTEECWKKNTPETVSTAPPHPSSLTPVDPNAGEWRTISSSASTTPTPPPATPRSPQAISSPLPCRT